jgi:hypothetical protein
MPACLCWPLGDCHHAAASSPSGSASSRFPFPTPRKSPTTPRSSRRSAEFAPSLPDVSQTHTSAQFCARCPAGSVQRCRFTGRQAAGDHTLRKSCQAQPKVQWHLIDNFSFSSQCTSMCTWTVTQSLIWRQLIKILFMLVTFFSFFRFQWRKEETFVY